LSGMADDLRRRADARLDDALARDAVADPRGPLREAMRALREEDAAAFERARRRFEDELVPRVAADESDPVAEWIEYGRFLAELHGAGAVVAIGADGRARNWAAPYHAGQLVLHLPSEPRRRATVLAAPQEPSPPQRAALGLLSG
jgi:hypothetical protein